MSPEGRRRFVLAMARLTILAAVVVGVVAGTVEITRALRENPRSAAVTAGAPLGAPQLETTGFLGGDPAWLGRILALPRNATLIALDLDGLRARLLAQGQVQTAVLTKVFPATLRVRLTERTPMARLMAQEAGGDPRMFLVARDGVVFTGVGYPDNLVATLPWLETARLTREGSGFEPIAGMAALAELLGKTKLEAEHLYADWRVVSLSRLNTDGEIDVLTGSGATITFNANNDYYTQIANLDLALDRLAMQGTAFRRLNLANGRDVTVTLEKPLVPTAANLLATPFGGVRPPVLAPAPAFGKFPQPSLLQREF